MCDNKQMKNDIKFVLGKSISEDYLRYILDVIVSDIIEDLEASADEEYNEDDIRMAFGRVLANRLGIIEM